MSTPPSSSPRVVPPALKAGVAALGKAVATSTATAPSGKRKTTETLAAPSGKRKTTETLTAPSGKRKTTETLTAPSGKRKTSEPLVIVETELKCTKKELASEKKLRLDEKKAHESEVERRDIKTCIKALKNQRSGNSQQQIPLQAKDQIADVTDAADTVDAPDVTQAATVAQVAGDELEERLDEQPSAYGDVTDDRDVEVSPDNFTIFANTSPYVSRKNSFEKMSDLHANEITYMPVASAALTATAHKTDASATVHASAITANELGKRLAVVEAELHRTKERLEQADEEVERTNAARMYTDGELIRTDAELERTEEELERTRSELTRTHAEAFHIHGEFMRTDAELKYTKAELNRINAKRMQTYAEFTRTQAELKRTQAELKRTAEKLKMKDLELMRTKTNFSTTLKTETELRLQEQRTFKQEIAAREAKIGKLRKDIKVLHKARDKAPDNTQTSEELGENEAKEASVEPSALVNHPRAQAAWARRATEAEPPMTCQDGSSEN